MRCPAFTFVGQLRETGPYSIWNIVLILQNTLGIFHLEYLGILGRGPSDIPFGMLLYQRMMRAILGHVSRHDGGLQG
jgi:hypothetical protein